MPRPTHADAELLLRLYDVRREPELRTARKWFLSEFKPSGWSEIKSRYLSHDDEDRWFRMTISYWEMVGTLVNGGVMNADLFFDHTGEDIVTWERCKPWIDDARRDIRPTYLQHFERMVGEHLAHRAKGIAALAARKAGKAAGVSRPRIQARAGAGGKKAARRAPRSR